MIFDHNRDNVSLMCKRTLRKSISHWNKIDASDVVKQ